MYPGKISERFSVSVCSFLIASFQIVSSGSAFAQSANCTKAIEDLTKELTGEFNDKIDKVNKECAQSDVTNATPSMCVVNDPMCDSTANSAVQCPQDLSTCDADLAACTSSLASCTDTANAQASEIDSLNASITSLSESLTSLQSENDDLTSSLAACASQISSLNTQVSSLSSNLSECQNDLSQCEAGDPVCEDNPAGSGDACDCDTDDNNQGSGGEECGPDGSSSGGLTGGEPDPNEGTAENPKMLLACARAIINNSPDIAGKSIDGLESPDLKLLRNATGKARRGVTRCIKKLRRAAIKALKKLKKASRK